VFEDLLGTTVQWHHTVLHGKAPEMSTLFPMHQDYPFYPHDGPDFVDCLLHLDDTPLDSGALLPVKLWRDKLSRWYTLKPIG